MQYESGAEAGWADMRREMRELSAKLRDRAQRGTSEALSAEAAILNAVALDMTSYALIAAATKIDRQLENVGAKVEGFAIVASESEKHLASRIDAFTAATDTSSRTMAWLTAALVLFAFVQVAIAAYSAFNPTAPQVVPVLPPRLP